MPQSVLSLFCTKVGIGEVNLITKPKKNVKNFTCIRSWKYVGTRKSKPKEKVNKDTYLLVKAIMLQKTGHRTRHITGRSRA